MQYVLLCADGWVGLGWVGLVMVLCGVGCVLVWLVLMHLLRRTAVWHVWGLVWCDVV